MKSILLALCMMSSLASLAQSRQIKMYLEQIAANKVYIEYLQKGYSTVKNGLGVLSSIKAGHYSLDQLFFHGLVAINPNVRKYPRVADIIVLTAAIRQKGKEVMRLKRGSELFIAGHVSYAQGVIDGMNDACTALLRDLDALLAPGNLQLSDDERIKRIDLVFADVTDRYQFIQSWSGEIAKLLNLMKREKQDVRVMEKITGIK
ncbi:MAG: hypothetical protein ACTHMC_17720 [Pseudobacter sp.]|uniref:hypothetical protein n=1 Tax=Pseudobacter sp. TaxID=2045420 RepID=UPI003F81F2DF